MSYLDDLEELERQPLGPYYRGRLRAPEEEEPPAHDKLRGFRDRRMDNGEWMGSLDPDVV